MKAMCKHGESEMVLCVSGFLKHSHTLTIKQTPLEQTQILVNTYISWKISKGNGLNLLYVLLAFSI